MEQIPGCSRLDQHTPSTVREVRWGLATTQSVHGLGAPGREGWAPQRGRLDSTATPRERRFPLVGVSRQPR